MLLHVNVPLSIFREGKRFVAFTPALDLSTSGKSLAEAKSRFSEAVQLFFEELERMGTVDETLSDLGWHKAERKWQAPQPIFQDTQRVQVAV
ncbi:MAG: type II toxin-antitoxin system HicB family antitoxin [Patescibacteria group bacterium]|mgnify:FL=1